VNILLKVFISIFLSLPLLGSTAKNIEQPKQTVKKSNLLIGYYGRPNTKALGILGQSNIDVLVQRMKEKKKYYENELKDKFNIQMAFHIIYGLATTDAGKKNTYMLGLSQKSLMRYIKRAQKENFKVIIDLQMGTNTPVEALTPVLKYLKYDCVHLALDPEFKIPKHRRYPPGKYVGHIFAQDLNDAQKLISEYLIENNLGTKKLIVHMFHPRMLRKKEEVEKYSNIDLIYNIDGHGDPASKIKIYNSIYTKNELTTAKSGFKVFYQADTKEMTPKQIVGWEATRGRQVWKCPYYINYQ
jgi:hypothetical protein